MKDRLDKVLFELGYFETKNKAQAAIMAGDVKIDNVKMTKAGTKIEYSDKMRIEIKRLLNKLAPEYAVPLLLKTAYGLTYEEIAEIMEIKTGTVRSRISRAKRMLEKQMASEKES